MPPRPKLSYYSYDSLGNPWVSGGGAVRDFETLRRFAHHAEITLHVARYPGFRDRDEHGIRIRGIGFGNRNWLCRITYALAANLRLLFDRADAIGCSASPYAPVLTGLLFPRRYYAVFHHAVGTRASQKYGAAGLLPRLAEFLFFRFGRNYVVSNASLTARIREGNPRAQVLVTFNGFPDSLLSVLRKPASPPYVLFLGRFDVYMKGLDLLIPAWAESLAPRGIDLVLAGRAPAEDLAKVRALAAATGLPERVRVELDIAEERKTELLAGCLFFASPSRYEGFGIAALEANAAGAAVLATDTDGFRDSLDLGTTALSVPVEDSTALRQGLLRLAEDAGLRERMGAKGRERARAFSWDAIAEKEWNWITEHVPGAARRG